MHPPTFEYLKPTDAQLEQMSKVHDRHAETLAIPRVSQQPAKGTGRRLLSDVKSIGRRVLFATS